MQSVDQNQNRILNLKTIYYTQVDKLLREAVQSLVSNFNVIFEHIQNNLQRSLETSNIEIDILDSENKCLDLINRIDDINTLNLIDEAKTELLSRLNIELRENNIELSNLKHELLMKYNYEKNIPMFLQKLKLLMSINNIDLKELFTTYIAIDRENFKLCIHLSNRNIKTIDLVKEINNPTLYNGIFPFEQTRLSFDVKWAIILI